MIISPKSTDKGVAMILVLMVTSILAILVLQFGQSSRSQVMHSQAIFDQTKATLELTTAESTILFNLLTKPWSPNSSLGATDNRTSDFAGSPFLVENVLVRVQDVGGLLVLPQPGSSSAPLRSILETVTSTPERAQRLSSFIEALPAPPQRLPFQDLSELDPAGLLSTDEMERLRRYVSLHPVPAFNPVTAPADVVRALYPDANQEPIMEAKKEGRLDYDTLVRLTGRVGDEFVSFSPGPVFKITLSQHTGKARTERALTVRIRPTARAPVELLELR